MKVFISYSMEDTEQVQIIADQIKPYVEEVHWWKESKTLGEAPWEMIEGWIDRADMVIAVITGKTVSRAMSVGQELGHAKEKGKKIIPIVEQGISKTELGFLENATYSRFDRDDPEAALDEVKKSIETERQNRLLDKAVEAINLPTKRVTTVPANQEGSVLPAILIGTLLVGGLYLALKE
jgi:hypothetical protein